MRKAPSVLFDKMAVCKQKSQYVIEPVPVCGGYSRCPTRVTDGHGPADVHGHAAGHGSDGRPHESAPPPSLPAKRPLRSIVRPATHRAEYV